MFSVIKKITVKCQNNNLTQLKFNGEGNNARNKDLDSSNKAFICKKVKP